ncbi:MAG TPA: AbrB/MazE/SpoVT family DNA-binding domain-containing protein [Candidatus Lokiarchaeia archaeon]|nr:AbrB/MazE/SpoVT family DNA-binding domain-containing protein [Candidatus Lokiarchaeia archaeon]
MEKQETDHVTLSSKGLLALPISLRKKYNLGKGSDLKIIDEGGKLILLPYSRAADLFGIAKDFEKEIHHMIDGLDQEHRENAEHE